MVSTWSNSVLSALKRLLDTHVLEVDLSVPDDPESKDGQRNARTVLAVRFGEQHPPTAPSASEGRHRRRQQMIPMMIFGVTVFGMFIIPIAFQFLTALSGKAFLMAKLALLLASINGLKRAHHPPPPFHQHPHAGPLLYDRAESLYADGPRRSGSTLAPFFSRLASSLPF
uniref:Uncharacterized protein n=1 Tax=Anopheles maculatus TaxID=74869 RepID=A0A182SVF1_9DIPT